MARYVRWLAAALTIASIAVLIQSPPGRTTAPAATDVLFVFDTTGSMSGALSEAKTQARGVMTSLSGRLQNLRFGVAQIKDYGDDPVWRVESSLTSDPAAVQTAIDRLAAGGGGDSPEAYGTALFQSTQDVAAGWAPGAKHLVVLIADDVPHDDELNAGVPADIVNQPSPWNTGVDPGPSGAGIDWQQELSDFKAGAYTLAFVLYHGDPAYLPYWNWWAGLTGGRATESTSSTPLGDILIEIISTTASTCQSADEDDPPQCDNDEALAFSSGVLSLPEDPGIVDSSDPDAPNAGSVPGTCPPGPRPTEDPQTLRSADAAGSAAAILPGGPWYCPEGTTAVPAVTWTQNTTAIEFRNADGVWTIYKRCIDGVSGSLRYAVGPGYIAKLNRGASTFVEDLRGTADTTNPGYINAVNGGLGTFGWHHARGPVNNTPAGDDPTTSGVTEVEVGRRPQVIEGRMCADSNNGYGVYARNWTTPRRISPTEVRYTMDVWLRDRFGATGAPVADALVRVRYKYTFYRSSVSLWALVTTYAAPNAAGTPFVKEPKFTALARGDYLRMAVFGGPDARDFRAAVTSGEPQGISVLHTEHAPQDDRKRVRWDFATTTRNEGVPNCSKLTPCINVVARSFPVASGTRILRTDQAGNWEGAGLGLDRWAVESASRSKSYPRDTRGDNVVSTCRAPLPRSKTEIALSKASEAASTDMDAIREWELGGWKSGKDVDPYQAALALFPGWEDGRGGWDCEPLQRAFGASGESWGSYFSYSLNEGWKLSG